MYSSSAQLSLAIRTYYIGSCAELPWITNRVYLDLKECNGCNGRGYQNKKSKISLQRRTRLSCKKETHDINHKTTDDEKSINPGPNVLNS